MEVFQDVKCMYVCVMVENEHNCYGVAFLGKKIVYILLCFYFITVRIILKHTVSSPAVRFS
jgi:hypothetical protein